MNTWLFIRSLRPSGGVKKGMRVAVIHRGHQVIGDDRLQTDDLLLALGEDSLASGPGDPVPASPAAFSSAAPPTGGASSGGGDSASKPPGPAAAPTSVTSGAGDSESAMTDYNLASASSGGGESEPASPGSAASVFDPGAAATTEKTVTNVAASQALTTLVQEWQKDQHKYTRLIGNTFSHTQADTDLTGSESAVPKSNTNESSANGNDKPGCAAFRKPLLAFQPTFLGATSNRRLDIGKSQTEVGKDLTAGEMEKTTGSARDGLDAADKFGDQGPSQTILCSSLLATTITIPEGKGGDEKVSSGAPQMEGGSGDAPPSSHSTPVKPGYFAANTPLTVQPNIDKKEKEVLANLMNTTVDEVLPPQQLKGDKTEPLVTCPPPETLTNPPPQTLSSSPPETLTSPPPQTVSSSPPETLTSPPPQTFITLPPQTLSSSPPETLTSPPPQTLTSPLLQTLTSPPLQTFITLPPQTLSSSPPQTLTSPPPKTLSSSQPQTSISLPSQTVTSSLPQTSTSHPPQTSTSPPPQTSTSPPPQSLSSSQPQTLSSSQPQTLSSSPPQTLTSPTPQTLTNPPPQTSTIPPPQTSTSPPPQTFISPPPQTNGSIGLKNEELIPGAPTERRSGVAGRTPPDVLSDTAIATTPPTARPAIVPPQTDGSVGSSGKKTEYVSEASGRVTAKKSTSPSQMTTAQPNTSDMTKSIPTSLVKGAEYGGLVERSRGSPVDLMTLTSARYQELMRENLTAVKEMLPQPGLRPFSLVPGPSFLKALASVSRFVPVVGSQLVATSLYSLHSLIAKIDGRNKYMGMYPYFYLLNKYGPMMKLDNPVGADVLLMAVNGLEYPVIHVKSKAGRLQSLFDSLNIIRRQSPTLSHMAKFDVVTERIVKKPSLNVGGYYSDLEKVTDDLLKRQSLTRKYDDSGDGDVQMRLLNKWAVQGTMSVYFGSRKDAVTGRCEERLKMAECVGEVSQRLRMCETGVQLWRFMPTFDWYNLVEYSKQLDRLIMGELVECIGSEKSPENRSRRQPLVELLLAAEELRTADLLTPLTDLLLINVNTVSRTTGHVLYQLASAPNVQSAVYKEVNEAVVGGASSSDHPTFTYTQISSMKYLRACIFETLRLAPPVPVLSRQLEEDTRIHNTIIPKGTLIQMVNVLPWIRGGESFDETGRFQPERWLEPGGGVGGDPLTALPSWTSFPHFNRDLVLTQIALLVAKVVFSYKVEASVADLKPDGMLFPSLVKTPDLAFLRRQR